MNYLSCKGDVGMPPAKAAPGDVRDSEGKAAEKSSQTAWLCMMFSYKMETGAVLNNVSFHHIASGNQPKHSVVCGFLGA